MTIIDEMRKAQATFESLDELGYAAMVKNWADALEQSGALVPVKVGEVCELIKVRIGGHVRINGELYWYDGGDMDTRTGYLRSIPAMDSLRELMDTRVQPVRLVAITEWEGE